MSFGRVLTIPGLLFNNPSAPKIISVDPLESSGSLLLLEPASTVTPWAPGVPANGAVVPNVLSKFASALGVLSPEQGASVYDQGMVSPTALMQRSGKGGLYGIVSKVNTPPANTGFKLEFTNGLKTYLLANPTHKFFVSVWRKVTRAGSIEQFLGVHNASGGTNNYLFIIGADLIRPRTDGATFLGQRVTNLNAAGNSLINLGVNGWFGSPATTIATEQARAHSWGAPPGVGGAVTNMTSSIFYRFYMEDLTVSGRTYAEVDALDVALFEKQVLTEGGRYFADTFTDPATLP